MKILVELLPLIKEHHLSLSLANKCINIYNSNNKTAIAKLCQKVSDTFADEFANHFNIEEQFIFKIIKQKNNALNAIIDKLIAEHIQLLELASELSTDNQLLYKFGTLLQQHTRVEDRKVLPFLSDYLTQNQLNTITQCYDKN